MLTLEEIKARLVLYPEDLLIELLGVSSEDLVERFDDLIEDRIDYWRQQLAEDDINDEWHEGG